eukprot:2781022-Alexandrium_andersonii.AAC.1
MSVVESSRGRHWLGAPVVISDTHIDRCTVRACCGSRMCTLVVLCVGHATVSYTHLTLPTICSV